MSVKLDKSRLQFRSPLTVIYLIPTMPHFADEEMETQRGQEVCTVSHSWEMGLEGRSDA